MCQVLGVQISRLVPQIEPTSSFGRRTVATSAPGAFPAQSGLTPLPVSVEPVIFALLAACKPSRPLPVMVVPTTLALRSERAPSFPLSVS